MRSLWDWLFSNEPIAWVQQTIGLGMPLPFRILSGIGDTWGIILVAGMSFWLFGRQTFHAVLGITIAAAATRAGVLSIAWRDRPDGTGIVIYQHLEEGSFPSGHLLQAIAAWGLLAAFRCIPAWLAVLISAAVLVGRLYLGAHYLGDVIAAVIIGVILVLLWARFWTSIHAWFSRRGTAFRVVLWLVVVGTTVGWMLVVGGNARRFEVYGMVLGAAIAIPLERKLVRYSPDAGWSAATKALIVLAGTAGVLACLVWDRSQPSDALGLGTVTAGIATVWALLGVPALASVTGTRFRLWPVRKSIRSREP